MTATATPTPDLPTAAEIADRIRTRHKQLTRTVGMLVHMSSQLVDQLGDDALRTALDTALLSRDGDPAAQALGNRAAHRALQTLINAPDAPDAPDAAHPELLQTYDSLVLLAISAGTINRDLRQHAALAELLQMLPADDQDQEADPR